MRVVVAYVFPNLKLATYAPLARRFVRSYMNHPPGDYPHEVHVMVNQNPLTDVQKRMFFPIVHAFHNHNNFAKDIGAYMMASVTIPCDLLICLGAHIHFRKPGWLDWLVSRYLDNGPGLYGCWGFMQPAPHIRTTAFWGPPELFSTYPYRLDNMLRYEFEYGRKHSMLKWALDNGMPVGMVCWRGLLLYPNFKHVGIDDTLMLDQHTDRAGWKET